MNKGEAPLKIFWCMVVSIVLHWVLGITFMLVVTVSVLQMREVMHPNVLNCSYFICQCFVLLRKEGESLNNFAHCVFKITDFSFHNQIGRAQYTFLCKFCSVTNLKIFWCMVVRSFLVDQS